MSDESVFFVVVIILTMLFIGDPGLWDKLIRLIDAMTVYFEAATP